VDHLICHKGEDQAAKSDRLSSSLPVGIVFASFPTNTGGGGLRGTVTPAPTAPSSGLSRRPRPALTRNLKIERSVFPIPARNLDNTTAPFSLILHAQLIDRLIHRSKTRAYLSS
jgi:hypothetical protein